MIDGHYNCHLMECRISAYHVSVILMTFCFVHVRLYSLRLRHHNFLDT